MIDGATRSKDGSESKDWKIICNDDNIFYYKGGEREHIKSNEKFLK